MASLLERIDKYEQFVTYVDDRSGHDVRHAIDAAKIPDELNWNLDETFATGIRKMFKRSLANIEWCDRVKDGRYQGERLGVITS